MYDKEARIYKAQGSPKLGVGYFAQSIDSKFYFQGFTAGVQIPLSKKANKAKIEAVSISKEQSQLELNKNKLGLNLKNQQSQNEFEKQKKGVEYYKNEGLKFAEQIISTAQKSYENGDMNYWSYISFLNQAIDIKKQNIEAVNLYNQSAIQLQFPSISNN